MDRLTQSLGVSVVQVKTVVGSSSNILTQVSFVWELNIQAGWLVHNLGSSYYPSNCNHKVKFSLEVFLHSPVQT